MTLTPEIEAQGLKAYEQVCAYEQLQRRRMPLFYASFCLLWIILGLWVWGIVHNAYTALVLIGGILFAVGTWLHSVRLKAAYQKNLVTVVSLEKTYGDELSWVKVEKHFAAIEKIRQEEHGKNAS